MVAQMGVTCDIDMYSFYKKHACMTEEKLDLLSPKILFPKLTIKRGEFIQFIQFISVFFRLPYNSEWKCMVF